MSDAEDLSRQSLKRHAEKMELRAMAGALRDAADYLGTCTIPSADVVYKNGYCDAIENLLARARDLEGM